MSAVSGVVPKHVYHYSDPLAVNVRNTVAFQATCKCGWKGSWRNKRPDAFADYEDHKLTVHGRTD